MTAHTYAQLRCGYVHFLVECLSYPDQLGYDVHERTASERTFDLFVKMGDELKPVTQMRCFCFENELETVRNRQKSRAARAASYVHQKLRDGHIPYRSGAVIGGATLSRLSLDE